jgi:hypothetical protein
VPVTLWREAGLIHGFIRMSMVSSRAKAVLSRTALWMRKAMG